MPIPSCWLSFIYFSLISRLPTVTLCVLEKEKIPELAALQWTETLFPKELWDEQWGTQLLSCAQLSVEAQPLYHGKVRAGEVLEQVLLHLGPGYKATTGAESSFMSI